MSAVAGGEEEEEEEEEAAEAATISRFSCAGIIFRRRAEQCLLARGLAAPGRRRLISCAPTWPAWGRRSWPQTGTQFACAAGQKSSQEQRAGRPTDRPKASGVT